MKATTAGRPCAVAALIAELIVSRGLLVAVITASP
jgi:hypothetical protein